MSDNCIIIKKKKKNTCSPLHFQKTDVTNELVEELQVKTKEFLQPNPTARAKMAAVKGISKLSGQAKSNTYPQPEGLLADCMLMYGKKLGENSIFGEYDRDEFSNIGFIQTMKWSICLTQQQQQQPTKLCQF